MKEDKEIKALVRELEVLRNIAVAYSQISSTRIREERGSVLQNRQFQEAIDEIFKEVLASYARQVKRLAQKKGLPSDSEGKEKLTFLSHNGKTVAVFISANTGLYGDIVGRTFNFFLDEIIKTDAEVTIIGRLGLSLFLEAHPGYPYTYFEMPDYGISQEKLAEVTRHIVQYERIHVYYGKFQNVAYQNPDKVDISAETPLSQAETSKTRYLFEPTLEEILQFFETEIFASVFEHVVRESQLAKFASRMMAMDKASENIKERLKKMSLESLRRAHHRENRKQLNSLSSLVYGGGYR